MIRNDFSVFLLYMEPPASEKSAEPIEDKITELIDLAMSKAQSGASNYSSTNKEPAFYKGSGFRGSHTTACGQRSDSHDYLLENGMITNSLAPFYVRWYRNSISLLDNNKLFDLAVFYDKLPL